MMISIVQMVLVPVLLGLGVNHFFSRSVEKVLPAMPVISVVTIVILVGCVVSLSASRLFDVGLLMAVIVVLHNVFGLTLGYLMAKLFRLDSKKSRTVAIEVGMQIPEWQLPWRSCTSIRQRLFPGLFSVSGTIFPDPSLPTTSLAAMKREAPFVLRNRRPTWHNLFYKGVYYHENFPYC